MQRNEAAAQPVDVPAGNTLAAEVLELKKLKDAGILTEEEFEAVSDGYLDYKNDSGRMLSQCTNYMRQ